jgi:cytochrome c-type biogenesis protein CcmH
VTPRRGQVLPTALAIVLVALLACTPAAWGEGSASPRPRAELSDIEDEVMCPICGTALNLSQSPQAEAERAFIRRRLARGDTKDEVKAALVAQYGRRVLAEPEKSGFELTAWVLPVVALTLAAFGLTAGVRRWRRSTAGSEAPPPVDADDARRLEADMSRYDL